MNKYTIRYEYTVCGFKVVEAPGTEGVLDGFNSQIESENSSNNSLLWNICSDLLDGDNTELLKQMFEKQKARGHTKHFIEYPST